MKHIYDYIAKDSEFYARNVTTGIIEKSEKLEEFPEIKDVSIRELIIYSHRLIYKVTQSEVYVLALIHGRQDFPTRVISRSKIR